MKEMAVVWHISAIHLDNNTILQGVLLAEAPPVSRESSSAFRNMLRVIQSYTLNTYAHEEITILSNARQYKTSTDAQGSFLIQVENPIGDDLQIFTSDEKEPLPILQQYPIIFEQSSCPFEVISDIDDTILVSYSARLIKRLKTLLFTLPTARKTIVYTNELLAALHQKDARIFYVSKSESNLFGIISRFIEHNNLPKGILMLSPYLKFSQLIRGKKGKDYKINLIRRIITGSANKSFFLIGDDSQRDVDVYTQITSEFPGRILKIYIRQTVSGKQGFRKRKLEQLKIIGVPVKYILPDDNVEDEINTLDIR